MIYEKLTEEKVADQIAKVTNMMFELKTIKDHYKRKEFRKKLRIEYDLMLEMYRSYLSQTDDLTFKHRYKIIKLKALRLSI